MFGTDLNFAQTYIVPITYFSNSTIDLPSNLSKEKIMVKKIVVQLGLAIFVATLSCTAHAQVAPKFKTATVEVTTTVESNCEISANPLAFGKYDPLSTTTRRRAQRSP